jgi:hypothetical protein
MVVSVLQVRKKTKKEEHLQPEAVQWSCQVCFRGRPWKGFLASDCSSAVVAVSSSPLHIRYLPFIK